MKHKKKKNILVLNCGSSSLKYKLIRMPDEIVILHGEAERVGTRTLEKSVINHVDSSGRITRIECMLENHSAAFTVVMEKILEDTGASGRIDAFAHRYVHPGKDFSGTVALNDKNIKKLEETLKMAPIHNPVSLGLIKECSRKYPDIEQYAVFDTSFHFNIPPENRTYALPYQLCGKYGFRKYGFHGTSHHYVMREACKALGRDPATQKVISCHLGSGGSSVCAIDSGRSINNTMGFTPLEGLLMSTRAGDVDPALVFNMIHREKIEPEKAEELLNKRSGILCVSEKSSDLRDMSAGDPGSELSFELYSERVKKYISYYALLLRGVDILIFTDTLGCSLPRLRASVCAGMDIFGIRIDEKRNNGYAEGVCDISDTDYAVRIMVTPTDEEMMIARKAFEEMKS